MVTDYIKYSSDDSLSGKCLRKYDFDSAVSPSGAAGAGVGGAGAGGVAAGEAAGDSQSNPIKELRDKLKSWHEALTSSHPASSGGAPAASNLSEVTFKDFESELSKIEENIDQTLKANKDKSKDLKNFRKLVKAEFTAYYWAIKSQTPGAIPEDATIAHENFETIRGATNFQENYELFKSLRAPNPSAPARSAPPTSAPPTSASAASSQSPDRALQLTEFRSFDNVGSSNFVTRNFNCSTFSSSNQSASTQDFVARYEKKLTQSEPQNEAEIELQNKKKTRFDTFKSKLDNGDLFDDSKRSVALVIETLLANRETALSYDGRDSNRFQYRKLFTDEEEELKKKLNAKVASWLENRQLSVKSPESKKPTNSPTKCWDFAGSLVFKASSNYEQLGDNDLSIDDISSDSQLKLGNIAIDKEASIRLFDYLEELEAQKAKALITTKFPEATSQEKTQFRSNGFDAKASFAEKPELFAPKQFNDIAEFFDQGSEFTKISSNHVRLSRETLEQGGGAELKIGSCDFANIAITAVESKSKIAKTFSSCDDVELIKEYQKKLAARIVDFKLITRSLAREGHFVEPQNAKIDADDSISSINQKLKNIIADLPADHQFKSHDIEIFIPSSSRSSDSVGTSGRVASSLVVGTSDHAAAQLSRISFEENNDKVFESIRATLLTHDLDDLKKIQEESVKESRNLIDNISIKKNYGELGLRSSIEIIRDKNDRHKVDVILQGEFDQKKDVVSISIDANYSIVRQFQLEADGNNRVKIKEQEGYAYFARYDKETNQTTEYRCKKKSGWSSGLEWEKKESNGLTWVLINRNLRCDLEDLRVIDKIEKSPTTINIKILEMSGNEVGKIKGITAIKTLEECKKTSESCIKGLATKFSKRTNPYLIKSSVETKFIKASRFEENGLVCLEVEENGYKIFLKRLGEQDRKSDEAKGEFKIVVMKDGKECIGLSRKNINNITKQRYEIFDETRQQTIDLELKVSNSIKDFSLSNAAIVIKSAKISQLNQPSSAISGARAMNQSSTLSL